MVLLCEKKQRTKKSKSYAYYLKSMIFLGGDASQSQTYEETLRIRRQSFASGDYVFRLFFEVFSDAVLVSKIHFNVLYLTVIYEPNGAKYPIIS